MEISGVARFVQALVSNDQKNMSLVARSDAVATSPPVLRIMGDGASVTLTWTATGSWVLETASSLTGNWHPVNAAAVENNRFTVNLPPTGAVAFFRLR